MRHPLFGPIRDSLPHFGVPSAIKEFSIQTALIGLQPCFGGLEVRHDEWPTRHGGAGCLIMNSRAAGPPTARPSGRREQRTGRSKKGTECGANSSATLRSHEERSGEDGRTSRLFAVSPATTVSAGWAIPRTSPAALASNRQKVAPRNHRVVCSGSVCCAFERGGRSQVPDDFLAHSSTAPC